MLSLMRLRIAWKLGARSIFSAGGSQHSVVIARCLGGTQRRAKGRKKTDRFGAAVGEGRRRQRVTLDAFARIAS